MALVFPTRRHDTQFCQRLPGGWRRPLQVILAQPLDGHLEFLARLQVLAEVQMPAEPVKRCFRQQPEVCRQGRGRQSSPQLFQVAQQVVLNQAVHQFLLESGDGVAADSMGHVEEVNTPGGEFGLRPGKLIQGILYLLGIRHSLSLGRGDRTGAPRLFLRGSADRRPHDQGALLSPHPDPLPFGRGEGESSAWRPWTW